MTTRIPHFIDGKRSELASTRTADVMNPSTGEVQAQVLLAAGRPTSTPRWPRRWRRRRSGPRGTRSAAPA